MIEPRDRIAQYQVVTQIGAGGMGEVFRARDTRLNREVAIKVLPKAFASDPDRLRRFEQESKTLAALNHPNILTIHDAGVQDGTPYLVSELLEGRTLREELSGGALSLQKSTDFGLQIAQGLAAAHSKGIIHRDLKPENIFLTKDGRLKILDFGLAKLQENFKFQISNLKCVDGEAPTLADSTQPGMVLGTPAYMSPEQVRGEPADHRSDIFAFGCVLYEMLMGQRAFRRDTPVESMNAVLRENPPEITSPEKTVPLGLERIVRRCLEKQPDNRFQSAKDLAFALENASGATPLDGQGSPSSARRASPSGLLQMLPWAVSAALAVVLVGMHWRSSPPPSSPVADGSRTLRSFDLTLPLAARPQPDGDLFTPAISPDGKKIAYANADGLWLRRLDRTAPEQLVSGKNIVTPFWSPDSSELGYFERRQLFRVPIETGRPSFVCPTPEDTSSGAGGGAWLTRDRIVFATGSSGLYEVDADGGRVASVCPPKERESDFHNPSALPGGQGVLFSVHHIAGIDAIALWLPSGQRKLLLQLAEGSICFYPVFAPPGYIVFQRSDEAEGIWAFRFSLEKLERLGDPVRISRVGTIPTVSEDGTLIFGLFNLGEFAPRQLAWVDRTGKVLNAFGPVMQGLGQQRLSPDGTSVVAAAGENLSGLDIWIISSTGNAVPISRNPEMEGSPFWWNAGRTVVFARRDAGTSKILAKPADGIGEEQLLFEGLLSQGGNKNHMCLSSSGNYFIAARASTSGKSTSGYSRMGDPDRRFVPFPEGFQDSSTWSLSPDDRFLAYQSVQSGQVEIYVVDFPGFGKREKVSREGGRHPVWDPAGRQLFFMTDDGRSLMVARSSKDDGQFDTPERMFDLPDDVHAGYAWWPSFYDVAPGGERFLMLRNVVDPAAASHEPKPNLLVVQNWFKELPVKP